jgi:hypothetical protein
MAPNSYLETEFRVKESFCPSWAWLSPKLFLRSRTARPTRGSPLPPCCGVPVSSATFSICYFTLMILLQVAVLRQVAFCGVLRDHRRGGQKFT